MGGRNTVLLDAISCRIPLVSDIPTIIFGADVTHPENGEETSPSIAAVKFLTVVPCFWTYFQSPFSHVAKLLCWECRSSLLKIGLR